MNWRPAHPHELKEIWQVHSYYLQPAGNGAYVQIQLTPEPGANPSKNGIEIDLDPRFQIWLGTRGDAPVLLRGADLYPARKTETGWEVHDQHPFDTLDL